MILTSFTQEGVGILTPPTSPFPNPQSEPLKITPTLVLRE